MAHGTKKTVTDCLGDVNAYCEEDTDQCASINYIVRISLVLLYLICSFIHERKTINYFQQCAGLTIGNAPKPCPGGYCQFLGGDPGDFRLGECVKGVPPVAACPDGLTGAAANEFTCTNEGYVPDPTSCRKYYFCRKYPNGTLSAIPNLCAPGMMYNKVSNNCNLRYSASFCTTIDCKDLNYDLRLFYSHSNQFWAQCIQGEPPTIIAGACPVGFEVDLSSVTSPPKCNYKCTGAGYFKHSQDPTKYVHCYLEGWTYKSVVSTCPPGLTFRESGWGAWFSACGY